MKKQTIEIKYKSSEKNTEIIFKKNNKKINITPNDNKIELKTIYEYLELMDKENIVIDKKNVKIENPTNEGEVLYNNCLLLFKEIEKEVNKISK